LDAIDIAFTFWEICSSQDIFSGKIDEFFEDLTGVTCIPDNMLVYGRTKQENDENLKELLLRVREKGMIFNPDKCIIGANEVKHFVIY
jgi:hypothetical protein